MKEGDLKGSGSPFRFAPEGVTNTDTKTGFEPQIRSNVLEAVANPVPQSLRGGGGESLPPIDNKPIDKQKKPGGKWFKIGGPIAGLITLGGAYFGLKGDSSDNKNNLEGDIGGAPSSTLNGETSDDGSSKVIIGDAVSATPVPEKPIDKNNLILEGSRGNVDNIDQLNIPENQKEAIKKMTEGATKQIIVDFDGQVVIMAIDDDMLNSDNPKALKSITLNLNKFPDAGERLVGLVKEAKYQAFKYKTGSQISFEDYKNSNNTFLIHAEDVISGNYSNYSVNAKAPYVIVLTGNPEDNSDRVELADGYTLAPQYGNGVIGHRFYQAEPGVGVFNEGNIQKFEYEFALNFQAVLLELSNKSSLNLAGKGFSNFNNPELAPIINKRFTPYSFDINPDTGLVKEKTHYPSIFITSGTESVR